MGLRGPMARRRSRALERMRPAGLAGRPRLPSHPYLFPSNLALLLPPLPAVCLRGDASGGQMPPAGQLGVSGSCLQVRPSLPRLCLAPTGHPKPDRQPGDAEAGARRQRQRLSGARPGAEQHQPRRALLLPRLCARPQPPLAPPLPERLHVSLHCNSVSACVCFFWPRCVPAPHSRTNQISPHRLCLAHQMGGLRLCCNVLLPTGAVLLVKEEVQLLEGAVSSAVPPSPGDAQPAPPAAPGQPSGGAGGTSNAWGILVGGQAYAERLPGGNGMRSAGQGGCLEGHGRGARLGIVRVVCACSSPAHLR